MYIVIFISSIFVSSVSQVLLKSSTEKKYDNAIKEFLNFKVIFAYGLFFLSTLMTVLAYRGVPMSMGPILEASGYIFVAVLSYVFLHEKISKRKLLGLVIILTGIMIFNL